MASGALLRPAVAADVPDLAAGMIAGLEDYPTFARPGWQAPSAADEEAHLRHLLADPGVWSCVAEIDGRIVGQIMLVPADRAARPVDEPGLMHLRNLFVDREHWGGGLATALHAASIDAARERGYVAMRLFVATGQLRAQRFYVREGWAPVGEPFHAAGPDLELIELRRPVS
jgi:GNAT superfamily N-acetyltransferase